MPPVVINLTTQVPVEKTVQEIEALLRTHGVMQVSKIYDPKTRQVTGLSFVRDTAFGPREFRLPVRTETLFKRLYGARKRLPYSQAELNAIKQKDQAQAERTAWRLLLDNLRVLLSVEALDQPLEEMLFAWMVDQHTGQTVFERAKEQLLLPPGEDA